MTAVPPFHRKAETGPAHLDIGPARRPLGRQKCGNAGSPRHPAPATIGLLAHQHVARLRRAETICASLHYQRFGTSVAIEVAYALERPGLLGRRARVRAPVPLAALKPDACGPEGRGALAARKRPCALAGAASSRPTGAKTSKTCMTHSGPSSIAIELIGDSKQYVPHQRPA